MDLKNIYSSEDNNFTSAPNIENLKISENASYVHYCTNETIHGNAIHEIPNINKPLIADMSSSILSKPIEVKKFSLTGGGLATKAKMLTKWRNCHGTLINKDGSLYDIEQGT